MRSTATANITAGLTVVALAAVLTYVAQGAENRADRGESLAMQVRTACASGPTAAVVELRRVGACGQAEVVVQGIPGPAGERGTAGSPGSPGISGQIGPTGERGPAGSPGPIGPAGSPGPIGPPGPEGPAGDPGSDGADGAEGSPGTDGAPGERGSDGPVGPACPRGELRAVVTYGDGQTGTACVRRASIAETPDPTPTETPSVEPSGPALIPLLP